MSEQLSEDVLEAPAMGGTLTAMPDWFSHNLLSRVSQIETRAGLVPVAAGTCKKAFRLQIICFKTQIEAIIDIIIHNYIVFCLQYDTMRNVSIYRMDVPPILYWKFVFEDLIISGSSVCVMPN